MAEESAGWMQLCKGRPGGLAGSGNKLWSRSVKHVHLQACTTVKEILAQVGDAPERRAVPSAPVESSYGRKYKVFCQGVVTNIATYTTFAL